MDSYVAVTFGRILEVAIVAAAAVVAVNLGYRIVGRRTQSRPESDGKELKIGGQVGVATSDSGLRIRQFFSDLPKSARALVVDTGFLCLVAAFIGLVVWEVSRDAIEIHPISISPELEESFGLNSVAIAQRLADEILEIRRKAKASLEGSELAVGDGQADIILPGSDISVATIAAYFRRAFGFPRPRVTGELTKQGELVQLRIRIEGYGRVQSPQLVPVEKLDDAIAEHARGVERQLEPLFLAAFLEETNPDCALDMIREVIQARSSTRRELAVVYNLWGRILRSRNQLDEALIKYSTAVEYDSGFAIAYSNRGNVFYDLENYGSAVEDYNIAIALDPTYANAHNNLGMVYEEDGDFTRAILRYRRAIDLNPTEPSYYLNLGDALRKSVQGVAYEPWGQKALQEAENSYRRALDMSPGFSLAAHGLGVVLWQRGDLSDAIAYIRRARDLEPQSPDFQHDLGLVMEAIAKEKCHAGDRAAALGMLREAQSAIRKAMQSEANPSRTMALDRLGQKIAADHCTG